MSDRNEPDEYFHPRMDEPFGSLSQAELIDEQQATARIIRELQAVANTLSKVEEFMTSDVGNAFLADAKAIISDLSSDAQGHLNNLNGV